MPRYVNKFRTADISRGFAEEVWNRNKSDGTDLNETPSVEAQCTFVENLGTERSTEVPEGMDDEGDNQDFKGMLTSEEVATSDIRDKLRKV